ncbi:MAG TPA: GNAT family N-acetyltransferase [Flavobacterium sp.]|jgi:ribosomal-protein-alanine N-acetyltransferase
MIKQNFIISLLEPIDTNQLYEFVMSNNERLQRYFPVTLASTSTLKKTTEYIVVKNKQIEERTNFTFAIRDKNSLKIIGLIIIKKIDWDKGQAEFAYCIDSQFEGKGLTSFAVKEITKFAFDELGLKTLQIISHKTNSGSIKVAEKNGFVWQRTLPNEFTPTNETPLDMELYELYNEK